MNFLWKIQDPVLPGNIITNTLQADHIKYFEEWTHYKKGTKDEIEVDPGFREEMIKKEKELESKLQKHIDDLNSQNNKED